MNCGYAGILLYLPYVLALHLRPLDLPFISEDRKESVSQDEYETKAPDESDSVKEVCVAGAGIDPEMVEGWAEEGGV